MTEWIFYLVFAIYILLIGYVVVRSIISRIDRLEREMQSDIDMCAQEIDDLKKFLLGYESITGDSTKKKS